MGWTSEELPHFKEAIVKHLEDNRRLSEANWFELCGSLDDDEEYFRIGKGGEKQDTATRDAELYAFTNDLLAKYGNNQGELLIQIKCVHSTYFSSQNLSVLDAFSNHY